MVQRRTVLGFLLSALLFCNAVGAGLCATLCNSSVCCPADAVVKAAAAGCARCTPTANGKSVRVEADAEHSRSCCEWIAKKVDPPSTDNKLVGVVDQELTAILPSTPIAVVRALPTSMETCSTDNDRGPPSPPGTTYHSRAPPTVSV